jgi:dTDP-4-dehydrorhamnose reductase
VAEVLWALLASDATGIWHASAAGAASWFDVAKVVFEAAGADPANVQPCRSAELGRAAPRPAYTVLDCAATERRVGAPMPGWREHVTHYVRHDDLAGLGFAQAVA